MKNDDTRIYPLSGWNIGSMAKHGMDVIVFQPQYVASPISPDEMRQEDKHYGMTLPIAIELKEALEKAIKKFESDSQNIVNGDLN